MDLSFHLRWSGIITSFLSCIYNNCIYAIFIDDYNPETTYSTFETFYLTYSFVCLKRIAFDEWWSMYSSGTKFFHLNIACLLQRAWGTSVQWLRTPPWFHWAFEFHYQVSVNTHTSLTLSSLYVSFCNWYEDSSYRKKNKIRLVSSFMMCPFPGYILAVADTLLSS